MASHPTTVFDDSSNGWEPADGVHHPIELFSTEDAITSLIGEVR